MSAAPNSNRTTEEKKSPSAPPANGKSAATRLKSSLLEMPLAFEFNQGQTDAKVKYLTRAQNFTVFLMPTETLLRGRNGDVLRLKLQNANLSPKVLGEDRQAKISNYYMGNDRSKWLEGVPNFGQVRYRDVYSGIDLVYHSDQRQLEYDFVVKPGVDPNQIRFAFEGAKKIAITEQGELELQSAASTSVNHKPVVYQMIDGRRKLIEGEYTLANNVVGFKIGEYDRTQALVIDPTLQVLAFYGGTLNDEASGIATSSVQAGGAAGVVFIGRSQSPALPVGGPAKPSININWDAFATGLNAGTVGVSNSAGSVILWTTYYGGLGDDSARGVVMDNAGNVYIAGYTNSADFPKAASPAVNYDAYVAKLASAGGGLGTVTLYGGPGVDQATSIALDYSTFSTRPDANTIFNPATDPRVVPNVVVGGFTTGRIGLSGSPSGAVQPDGNQIVFNDCTGGSGACPPAATDGFVALFDSTLKIKHATYIGGGGNDQVNGVAADIWGNVYATGYATPGLTPLFPIVNGIGGGAADAALTSGVGVAFVAKWACTTTAAAGTGVPTPPFPIGVPSPPPQIPACGGGNTLKILSNSTLFGGSGSLINPHQIGQPDISDAGLAITVDQNGWGTHAVTSNIASGNNQVTAINPVDLTANSGFPNIVPFPDIFAVSTTPPALNSMIVSPISATFVEPCLPPGRTASEANANLCVPTPGVGFTNQGGFQPGLTGPRVYVVGSTANANFTDSLLSPSCAVVPFTFGPIAVPSLCPPPVVNGAARLPAGTLPVPANGPARIATINGQNSGQTQGWLVSLLFPAVTQEIVTPPLGAPTLATSLAPSTIPLYVVLQPPTCPGYLNTNSSNGGCVQGAPPALANVGTVSGAPPRCALSGGGNITCPDAFIGSWNSVAVGTDQQVYVVGNRSLGIRDLVAVPRSSPG
jgi:hypothetical protein